MITRLCHQVSGCPIEAEAATDCGVCPGCAVDTYEAKRLAQLDRACAGRLAAEAGALAAAAPNVHALQPAL